MGEEKKLVEGSIGTVGAYDVDFKAGKLAFKVRVGTETSQGLAIAADLIISVDAGKVIDAIELAVPGELDNAILEVLRKVLIPA